MIGTTKVQTSPPFYLHFLTSIHLFFSPLFLFPSNTSLQKKLNFIFSLVNHSFIFTSFFKTSMGFSERIPILVLRLVALGASVSATVIMVTSHDTADVLNMKFEAKYTNTPTFK